MKNKIPFIRRTLYQMLNDRGYILSDEQLAYANLSNEELLSNETFDYEDYETGKIVKGVISKYQDDITLFTNQENKNLLVMYADYTINKAGKISISVKNILTPVLYYYNKGFKKFIIIYPRKLKNSLKNLFSELVDIEADIFTYDDLKTNIINNCLQPRFVLLKKSPFDEETSNKLPGMDIDDPVAKYYGAKIGDVFEILRTEIGIDSLVSQYVVYRQVRTTIEYR